MMGTVTVVNKYKHESNYIYIGRGSVFGNPFPMNGENDRDECIEKFYYYFKKIMFSNSQNSASHDILKKSVLDLIERVYNGETIYLGCFCKPKACHGDVIKRYIDAAIKKLISLEKK
jgi:hypothetical protein